MEFIDVLFEHTRNLKRKSDGKQKKEKEWPVRVGLAALLF
jgi:hypothetical protein